MARKFLPSNLKLLDYEGKLITRVRILGMRLGRLSFSRRGEKYYSRLFLWENKKIISFYSWGKFK